MKNNKIIESFVLLITLLVIIFCINQFIIFMDIKTDDIQNFYNGIKDNWLLSLLIIFGIPMFIVKMINKRFYKPYKKNNSISHECFVEVKNISNYYGSVYLWDWKEEKKTFLVDQKFILDKIKEHTISVNKHIKVSDTEDNITPKNSTVIKFDNNDLISIFKNICVFDKKKNILYLQNTLYQFIKIKLNKYSVSINLKITDDKFKNLEFNKLHGTDFESENDITFLQ